MNRIDQMTGAGEKFFVAYYTAGFPTVEASGAILDTLVESGCDLIELGYPFSDPTADGPTIQSSSQAALENGFTRAAYFQLLEEFRERHPDVPTVVFSYYNPIFHYGIEKFAESAKTAGADGILIVDLPHEEQADVRAVLDSQGLHLIQLIAPTTGQERTGKILKNASGFVYQISLRGVTGVRDTIATDAGENVARTRAVTELPIALGFGVGTGEQARAVAAAADGVVVGSAIVSCIAENQPDHLPALRALVTELTAAVHG
ncbi:MAG: tryptophan synthase subunit alpha [Lentisphaeria bacterium]